ncbi:efflux RND transporter periplasmic adaptor subunit [Aestuariicella hydrocarbonica]|uniref:Efflux RND transporter periplasmic adaptor subunit n=1 Tax=Pseudomaricurvus hydrocarbonicus TaxID=1470433 RepID=A0A9E5JTJ8_9GAMM|nr:efflux RND transporter periplasmic adaptor subunit [Aestuariicella hydrocarbonica]NHO65044.1 efflux RND transporter periplasmic adaptor subunit [Aestuariicella hydrocarbonica]
MKAIKQYLSYIWSNRNYRISAYLAVLTLVWLGSGLVVSSSEDNVVQPHAKPLPKKTLVRARYIDAQFYQPEVNIRARTQANRQVSLRAELSGKVIALPLAEGQTVTAGEVVCELALEDRELRLLEARSVVAQAQLEYDGALRLKSGGYQSATAIAAAKARLDSAKAAQLRSKLDLENVKLRAPFSGVVDSYTVDVGDFMERGDECGVLLDLDPLIVRGQVSETEVNRLQRGKKAYAHLLTGEHVEGVVSLVGFGSDEVTRTFPVEVRVDNPELSLRSGITTNLSVPTEGVSAHVISSSLLSLDDEGQVGVRILSDDRRVEFVRVNLIGDHKQGVWVTGLPPHALLITVGQEYVSQGEVVDVTIDEPSEVKASVEGMAAYREVQPVSALTLPEPASGAAEL